MPGARSRISFMVSAHKKLEGRPVDLLNGVSHVDVNDVSHVDDVSHLDVNDVLHVDEV